MKLDEAVIEPQVSELDSIRFNVTLGKEEAKESQPEEPLQIRPVDGNNQGMA